MTRLYPLVLIFFVSALSTGCVINALGTYDCGPFDPDLQGCFLKEDEPRGQISIIQSADCPNQLFGTGSGFSNRDGGEVEGWTFTGSVYVERYAWLNVETESGATYRVQAVRPYIDPATRPDVTWVLALYWYYTPYYYEVFYLRPCR